MNLYRVRIGAAELEELTAAAVVLELTRWLTEPREHEPRTFEVTRWGKPPLRVHRGELRNGHEGV